MTIIIVAWNNASDIVQCLRAFEPIPAEWEVWVVDNGSQDETVRLVQAECPHVKLIANGMNIGFSRANNLVMSRTKSEYVLLLNPDTVASRSAIERAIEEMAQRPRAGIVSVQLRNTDGTVQASCFRFCSPLVNLVQAASLYYIMPWKVRGNYLLGSWWSHSEARAVDWVLGAFMLVRREAIVSAGPLPERYVLYGEDQAWCREMWKHGFEVWYCPVSSIVHHRNRSGMQMPLRHRVMLSQQGKYQFCLAEYGGIGWRFMLLTDLISCSLRQVWYSVFHGANGRPVCERMLAARQAIWKAMRWR